MSHEHLDVLIIGAGLSGIGAAHHLQEQHPHRSFALLESRESLGGTWDLFRYPGVRSDSDMHTLGFGFRPWKEAKAIADGPSILAYLQDTAAEYGIDRKIRYGRRVVSADWSTADSRWTVQVDHVGGGERETLTCSFLLGCTGYYRYDEGFTPVFPGRERFGGEIVHPQHWPEDLDYAGKRVVVIGSGATAVTLVPAMATDAAHVTMLQRSPTWIASLPSVDPFAERAKRFLPDAAAFPLTRWKNVMQQLGVFQLSNRHPKVVKRFLRGILERHLPDGYDIDRHFTPTYDPWDQRLCLVPDGDLFRAIRHGDAEIVTDHIETFTETGLRLRSGAELDADVVVTATGLNLLMLGGVTLAVDGTDVDVPEAMTYKGMMLEGVPNFAFAIGYTNASWTLKADLTGEYVGRLLKHMDEHGFAQATPVNDDPTVQQVPLLDFDAGYVLRSVDQLPRSGTKGPWKMRMNYLYDAFALRFGTVEDEAMKFTSPPVASASPAGTEGREAAAPTPV
ncbi:NAD(P)/FAD-dependent oxidoreductase [Patulibacter sp. NPDC049589]|uniref:flavin-containing monooxygenase n=1 Tax=Patulibacter sp. NPDC049589 TaxID=3154731 RepID=UPI00343FFBF2